MIRAMLSLTTASRDLRIDQAFRTGAMRLLEAIQSVAIL